MATEQLPPMMRWPVLASLGIALLPLLLQLPGSLAMLVAASWLLVSGMGLRWPLPASVRLLLVVIMLASIGQQMGLRPGRCVRGCRRGGSRVVAHRCLRCQGDGRPG